MTREDLAVRFAEAMIHSLPLATSVRPDISAPTYNYQITPQWIIETAFTLADLVIAQRSPGSL